MPSIKNILAVCGAVAMSVAILQCGGGTTPPADMAKPADMAMSPDLEMADAPTLTAVAPAVGPAAGGVVLTLTGQNFVKGATVTMAGAPATQVLVTSATTLTAVLPAKPGAWGKVPVLVKNPDAQSVSRSDLFGYYASQINVPGGTIPLGQTPESVAVADFNVDQKPDLVTAGSGANSLSFLVNLSQ